MAGFADRIEGVAAPSRGLPTQPGRTLFTRDVSTEESTSARAAADGSDGHSGARVRVRVRRRRARRRLVLLGVLLVVVLAGIALALLARPLVSAKHQAQAAQSDLTAAKDALSKQKVGLAGRYVQQARAHVAQAQDDVGGIGGDVWSAIPVAGTAVDDERHLVDALDQTTSVAEIGVQIYPIASGSSVDLVRDRRVDIPTLKDLALRTSAIGPHLDQALSDLSLVKGTTPLVGDSIDRAKTTALGYLGPLEDSYRTNEPLLRSLPTILGADGSRTYLLAMLNPAELRYSGGAALSFTSISFDHGVVSFGKTRNAEDLSGAGSIQRWPRVPGNTFHAQPALRVVNSTFSPWWSVSAEELLRGYQKAFPGQKFDGMVGIDLQGLANLFKITGPIDMPPVGQVTSDNLVRILAGSYGDFSSTEQRHQLNAALVPAFRQQFFEGGKMQEKVKSLVASAKGRHFFTYFRNSAFQNRFGRVGLSGDLSPTPYDYVGVFSQNLNGSKTDYWQHRKLTSTVHLRPDGSAQVDLQVEVTNGAPPYTLPTPDPKTGYSTRYLGTLVGVFMPRHSTLGAVRINGRPAHVKVHVPKVATVRDRKYVQGQMMLNYQQTNTMDVTYRADQGAQVLDSSHMVYSLTADPQGLVTPEVLHVTVIWPEGYHPTGPLPEGWRTTATGATYTGTLAEVSSWQIPLAKG
jgi:type II secretory pathway component PulM